MCECGVVGFKVIKLVLVVDCIFDVAVASDLSVVLFEEVSFLHLDQLN